MDFKNMLDTELANIMVNYINRVEHLRKTIARFLDGSDGGVVSPERIKNEYKELKYELRKDYNYLDKVSNHCGSYLYMNKFSPSIRAAYAYGFTVAVNHGIDRQMYNAVEEAHYRLTKYYNLEQWGEIM